MVVSSVVTTTAVDVDPLLDDVIVVVVASVASVVSAALSVVAAALEVTVLDDSVLALSVAAELEVESSGASAPPANSVVVVTVEDVVVGSSTGGTVGLGVGSLVVGGGVAAGGPFTHGTEGLHESQH